VSSSQPALLLAISLKQPLLLVGYKNSFYKEKMNKGKIQN